MAWFWSEIDAKFPIGSVFLGEYSKQALDYFGVKVKGVGIATAAKDQTMEYIPA